MLQVQVLLSGQRVQQDPHRRGEGYSGQLRPSGRHLHPSDQVPRSLAVLPWSGQICYLVNSGKEDTSSEGDCINAGREDANDDSDGVNAGRKDTNGDNNVINAGREDANDDTDGVNAGREDTIDDNNGVNAGRKNDIFDVDCCNRENCLCNEDIYDHEDVNEDHKNENYHCKDVNDGDHKNENFPSEEDINGHENVSDSSKDVKFFMTRNMRMAVRRILVI